MRSHSHHTHHCQKLTIKFKELFKSRLMKIPCSHQKSLFSMFVSFCLIRLPKISPRVTEVNLITEFLKSEKLKEYSLSSQS